MTTLKLKETPQSCGTCQLRGYNEALDYDDHEGYAGAICHGEKSLFMEVSDYLNTNTRHPDCPLEITEDNLRWINNGGWEYGERYTCPACNTDHYHFYGENNYGKIANFCSSCGIKLLPPEENHEK